jgi:hypothetical protein
MEYVLGLFDMETDEEGYVVDADGNRVESTDGNPVKPEDIGHIGHGSAEFVEDDISSLTEYLRD